MLLYFLNDSGCIFSLGLPNVSSYAYSVNFCQFMVFYLLIKFKFVSILIVPVMCSTDSYNSDQTAMRDSVHGLPAVIWVGTLDISLFGGT